MSQDIKALAMQLDQRTARLAAIEREIANFILARRAGHLIRPGVPRPREIEIAMGPAEIVRRAIGPWPGM